MADPFYPGMGALNGYSELNNLARTLTDGWNLFSDTITRVSDWVFTMDGDQTGINSIGDYIKITQTVNKYFALHSISYNSGTNKTTFNILGDPSYPIADAAIVNPCYSKIANPANYPHWFDYTPSSIVGWSSNPTNTIYRWRLDGRTVTVDIRQQTAGTSNATNVQIASPFTPRNITNMAWSGIAGAITDNGAVSTTKDFCTISAGIAIIEFYKNASVSGFTASGTKRVNGKISFEI